MAVLLKELVIKSEIWDDSDNLKDLREVRDENSISKERMFDLMKEMKQEILDECLEEIIEMLKKRQER